MASQKRDQELTALDRQEFTRAIEQRENSSGGAADDSRHAAASRWQELGVRPPRNLPGGPCVDPSVFGPFFELQLPREESLRVFWLIFEYRAWNQAYGKFLRELKAHLEQSQ